MPDFQFHIWLEPLEPAALAAEALYVRAPEHIRTWVGERYLPLLRASASRVLGTSATVTIVGDSWEAPAEQAMRAQPAARLNPKYTFQQFVIGDGNRFAHAAALAVAEMPGQAYNPLFIHGKPGLGKTHLLHAIANYVERYGSGLRVRYATVEAFTREFVEAVRAREHLRLQGRLPGRRRGPDRRRPAPDARRGHPRGVLPHLQRPRPGGPAAGADLRPPPR